MTTLSFAIEQPDETAGKALAVFIALLGVTLTSIITANVAALLLHNEETDSARLDEILESLRRIEAAQSPAADAPPEQQRFST